MNKTKLQAAGAKHQISRVGPRSGKPLELVSLSLILGLSLLFSLRALATQPSVSFAGLPLFFEPEEAILGRASSFLARGQNYQFRITSTGAEFVLCKSETTPGDLDDQSPTSSHQLSIDGRASRITHSRSLRMQLLGANPYSQIHADGILPGRINYLLGNDPAQWRTDLPVYSKVQLDEVFPGISLVYYGNQHQLEYDFMVTPGADPENIALHFDGVDQIEVNKDGDLVLSLGTDEICFHLPLLYQEVNGTRQRIAGAYQFKDAQTVVFQVGKYDHNLPLVIDPILSYSSYFGGNFGDIALGVKVFTDTDQNSFVYIAGETVSTKFPFPLTGADTNFNGGRINGDAFVAKFSSDASNLVYFTYIGGSEDDGALDLALDTSGNAYITGFTDSPDFPTNNAAFPKINGFRDPLFHTFPTDAFVAELNPTDGGLVYSTYLGGTRADVAGAIAVDSAGNAYVTGYTYSDDFSTNSTVYSNILTVVGYTNRLNNSNDVFVAQIGPNGAGLKYVTLFGGNGLDAGEGIAADDSGHVYVAGYTGSTNFYRTPNALPGTNGLGIREINGVTNAVKVYRGVRNVPFDAFLVRFNTGLSGTNSVEYSTFFGGKNDDAAFRIALYSNTDVIITGNSSSPDFPSNNFPAHIHSEASAANSDAFLTRFSFAPNGVVTNPPGIYYSTPFGGLSEDVGWGVALDPLGNVYVVGITASADFPGTNGVTASGKPLLRTNHIALRDVFVTAFKQDASALLYSVQMGGNNEDYGYGIAVDSTGSAYLVGRTISGNFPSTNVPAALFRSKRYGTNDAFLAKIRGEIALPTSPPPSLTTSLSGNSIQLAWPDSTAGFVLESTTNLASSSSWVPVSGFPVTTNGGFQQVEIPATNGNLFFRLRK